MTRDLDPKKSIERAIVQSTAVTGRELKATYKNTIEQYTAKMDLLKDEGVRAYKREAVNGEALLKNRIAGLVIYNEVQEQKKEHKGKKYRWIPSSAQEPDPEHQLLYGQIFKDGEGDKDGNMPGERYGCQCGIEWLDDDED